MSAPTLKLEVEELGPPPMSRPVAPPAPAPRPSAGRPSTPGSGFELLMKGTNSKEAVPAESVNDLAASLDQFVDGPPRQPNPTIKIESMGAGDARGPQPVPSVPAQPPSNRTVRLDGAPPVSGGGPPSALGQQAAAAVRTERNDRSWDGFRPFSGGSGAAAPGPAPAQARQLTEAEITAEKFKYIRALEALERKSVPVSKKYDMKSSLDEMKAEYNLIKEDIEKRQSKAFQGKMLMAAVSGLEYLNSKFDPFDVDLNGWGESVGENMEEYDDVFAELHEKYKHKASIAPEIKLMFLLAGSATMVHMTNTMFKPQLPGMDDLVHHNPELANRIAGAAADGLVARTEAPAPGRGGRPGQLPAPTHTSTPHGGRRMPPPGTVQAPPRAEMKGPDNFEEIMSRVKRKNADVALGATTTVAPTSTPTTHGTGDGVRFAAQPQASQASQGSPVPAGPPRTVSLKPTVLEGMQRAERSPMRSAPGGNRKRKAPLASDNVLKLEL
jgi:hypothetical protein